MYGNIKKISDNSNRVDAIENPEKSHDIVVMVSEYKENDSGADSGDIDKSSVTIVKDNKDVKYLVGYKEIDSEGNETNL